MKDQDSEDGAAHSDSAQSDAAQGDAGDVVESAGETTAAALISGPANAKPVGADTMVKVSGDESDKKEDAAG